MEAEQLPQEAETKGRTTEPAAQKGERVVGVSRSRKCHRRRRRMGIGKHCFIKNNMTRDDNFTTSKIKATITTLMGRIAEEDAGSGARSKFMRSSGREIMETYAAKNMEIGVIPGGVIKYLMGCILVETSGRKDINKNSGDREGFAKAEED